MRRKFLAGLLSLCLMFSLFPTAVFAEAPTTETPETPVVDETTEAPAEQSEPATETEDENADIALASEDEAAPAADVVYVAENADTGVKYTTLSEAISKAEDGQT
ncbi:MAG: hypothetical protein IJ339_04865, partial [Oscillospiraceae bacterium]|nr:hypothetical protein [Oscillospiraceae bacterium]